MRHSMIVQLNHIGSMSLNQIRFYIGNESLSHFFLQLDPIPPDLYHTTKSDLSSGSESEACPESESD